VIEMTTFDQSALFDRMAAEGRLDTAQVAALADEIVSFHQTCAVRTDVGGDAAIERVIDGNLAGLRQFGDTLSPAVCDAMTAEARACLRQCRGLLERRRRDGYVRECHGDLHLGNVVLVNERPRLFDAVEYNDDLSCIDVMYDLAFLLMDLWHRALPVHANTVLNRYLGGTHDLDGLSALPLFLSCRAAIRARTCATAASLQAPDGRSLLEAEAREYLDLAARLLHRPVPAIVAVGGLSGSGKSALARALAPFTGAAPGAIVLRSDDIRKRLWGVSPLTRLGPAGYTPEMSARVYEALAADAVAVAAAGHSAIVDAVFARPDERLAIERAARGAGVAFAAVWLEAPEDTLLERIARREADASDADADVVRMQCAQWAGDARWPQVDAVADHDEVLTRARTSLQAQNMAFAAA
jgi:predicted kinase